MNPAGRAGRVRTNMVETNRAPTPGSRIAARRCSRSAQVRNGRADASGLLPPSEERPCGQRAAEQGDELAAPHSRTSLACIRRVAGCATPTGSAGHAGAAANVKLTFQSDHSAGLIKYRTYLW